MVENSMLYKYSFKLKNKCLHVQAAKVHELLWQKVTFVWGIYFRWNVAASQLMPTKFSVSRIYYDDAWQSEKMENKRWKVYLPNSVCVCTDRQNALLITVGLMFCLRVDTRGYLAGYSDTAPRIVRENGRIMNAFIGTKGFFLFGMPADFVHGYTVISSSYLGVDKSLQCVCVFWRSLLCGTERVSTGPFAPQAARAPLGTRVAQLTPWFVQNWWEITLFSSQASSCLGTPDTYTQQLQRGTQSATHR